MNVQGISQLVRNPVIYGANAQPVLYAAQNNRVQQGNPYQQTGFPSAGYFNSGLLNSSLKFGSCICPVCASMAIMVEAHNRVKKLQAGDEIQPGALLSQITNKTGYNYIPHANATRITLPASEDIEALQKAALDKKPFGNGYKIEMPAQGSLYSVVSAALANGKKQPQYLPHPNNIDYSPHNTDQFMGKLNDLRTGEFELFSIIHHIQNDTEKLTKPISKGYVLAGQSGENKQELPLLSIRPLPEMENMDVPAAGLANVLSNVAGDSQKRFQSLAVTVENSQPDLKRYLEYINSVGLPVKRYAVMAKDQKPNGFELAEMPHGYQAMLNSLYPVAPSMFKVDVSPLYDWVKNGIPSQVQKAAIKLNPEMKQDLDKLMKSSSSPTLDQLLTILAPPPAPGSRQRKTLPRD